MTMTKSLVILREALTLKMKIWDLLYQAEVSLGRSVDEQILDDIGAGLNSPEDASLVTSEEFWSEICPRPDHEDD